MRRQIINSKHDKYRNYMLEGYKCYRKRNSRARGLLSEKAKLNESLGGEGSTMEISAEGPVV